MRHVISRCFLIIQASYGIAESVQVTSYGIRSRAEQGQELSLRAWVGIQPMFSAQHAPQQEERAKSAKMGSGTRPAGAGLLIIRASPALAGVPVPSPDLPNFLEANRTDCRAEAISDIDHAIVISSPQFKTFWPVSDAKFEDKLLI
ncbi:hypothetical protein C8R46DRAFT_1025253 [Mycena filopes]|nr:hypothetical protein C8R46DRAFT_1025253 [Mycena filopes]